MTTVEVTHHYDVPPRVLWEVVTDFGALAVVMRGLARFDGLPTGRCAAGQDFAVKVRLFGWLPPMDYRMAVEACDDEAMWLQSREQGSGARQWDHRIAVTDDGQGGAVLTDTIDLDAGWRTPVFALWARFLLKYRHRPRLRLLAKAETSDAT